MKSASVKVLVLVALFAAAVIPCFAADGTANLTLSGSVAPKTTIAISVPSATLSKLATAGAQTESIATLTEVCNKAGGFTVNVTSANLGYLKGGSSSPETINYSLTYGSTTVALTSANALLYSQTTKTSKDGATQALSVSYTGDEARAADTYTDTLTFTITAN
jgi:hypothetical protein